MGPISRESHAACKSNNYMYIFGGHSEDESLNDLWFFDFNFLQWTEIKAEGNTPSKREGHIMETI